MYFLYTYFNRSYFKKQHKLVKCEFLPLVSYEVCAYANCIHVHVLEDECSSPGFIRGLAGESLSWDKDAPILGNMVLMFISYFVQQWYRPCQP